MRPCRWPGDPESRTICERALRGSLFFPTRRMPLGPPSWQFFGGITDDSAASAQLLSSVDNSAFTWLSSKVSFQHPFANFDCASQLWDTCSHCFHYNCILHLQTDSLDSNTLHFIKNYRLLLLSLYIKKVRNLLININLFNRHINGTPNGIGLK